MAGKYNLGKEGLKELYDKIDLYAKKYEKYTRIVCDFPQKNIENADMANEIMKKYNLKCTGCSAATGGPAIRTDGAVSPCSLLDISYGNIIKNSIEDIYSSDVFENLLNRKLSGKCGTCDYRLVCGGCRAAAFLLTGDYLGEDVECFI